MKIGIVGVGKIVRDQHLPVLAANPSYQLAGVCNRSRVEVADAPYFASLDAMLAAVELDAVAICTPPEVRKALTLGALAAGKHVLLEKPPSSTLAELAEMVEAASLAGKTLYTAWHSQHAPGVEPAREWLAQRQVKSVEIRWLEDVQKWHPGQTWIWEPAGFGVFDPGINALSIATRILPGPLTLKRAELTLPTGHAVPLIAQLDMLTASGAPIDALFDFRPVADEQWDISVSTDAGQLTLSRGGSVLTIDGLPQPLTHTGLLGEYSSIYQRFDHLVSAGQSEVDGQPLQLVLEAMARGERREIAHKVI